MHAWSNQNLGCLFTFVTSREGTYSGQGTYPGQGTYTGQGTYSGQGAYSGQGTYSGQGAYSGQGTYLGQGAYSGQGTYSGQCTLILKKRSFILILLCYFWQYSYVGCFVLFCFFKRDWQCYNWTNNHCHFNQNLYHSETKNRWAICTHVGLVSGG